MQLLCRRNSRRITVAVGTVIRAMGRHVFAPWRLRELPHVGEANAALAGAGGMSREGAAGGGWAGVVDGPVDDGARTRVGTNVFGSDDVAVIDCGDSRAVDSGAEPGSGNAVDPRVDVGLLLGQHASALLLVEKDDGVRGKAFAVRGSDGGLRVGFAELGCVRDGFQFGVKASVEEH